MDDIIKIVKSLEDSRLLLKGITETVQNDVKEQTRGYISMLLVLLGFKFIRKYFSRKSNK